VAILTRNLFKKVVVLVMCIHMFFWLRFFLFLL